MRPAIRSGRPTRGDEALYWLTKARFLEFSETGSGRSDLLRGMKPDEVVFTVEYSVRAAQMGVYKLLRIERPVPPITRYDKSIRVLIDTLEKAFA